MYVNQPESKKPIPSFVASFAKRQMPFATGNRLYNGTSSSPHSGGGLDKTGYANRDAVAKTTKANLYNQLAKGKY